MVNTIDPANPVTVEIEKLVYGGDGLGRIEGQVVLAPFVLPGERVTLQTKPSRGSVLRGVSQAILHPSPQRISPRCEYFANCGGCHYQHAEYILETDHKREILRESLRRLGGLEYSGEIPIVSGDPWQYRNRIQLHFADRRPGFLKAESHELCAISHCEISSPVLNQVISNLQYAAKRPEWPAFLRSLEIFTNEHEIQVNIVDSTRPVAARFFDWVSSFIPHVAANGIDYAAAGEIFRISRGSFFQVNRFLIDSLVTEVLSDVHGKYAVDLYAGVGLFSLALSRRFEQVDAVERSGPAYRDLVWNAQRIKNNIRAMKASAEEFLRSQSAPAELLIADPPRAGLGKEATAELLRLKPEKLVLVSCDVATLARDLKRLAPQYRIDRLVLVDLFPRTYHFETVVHLSRI